MRVLILGHNGMLGHMVSKYLSDNSFEIVTLENRWPECKEEIKNFSGDYIINCIGAIPQRTKSFDINWELPIWLDENFNGRILHPGTDCEMDDDEYGLSKKKAADWIIENGSKTKMIRASIIGPELNSSSSFMEWFLSNEDNSEVRGYTNHLWNGVTTYYWAKFCKQVLLNWDKYNTRTTIGSNCVSKYELLDYFNEIYKRKINIIKHSTGEEVVDKCLSLDFKLIDIKQQIRESKDYYKQ